MQGTFKQRYRARVRAGFIALGHWWLASSLKKGLLALLRVIRGSGYFFFGASVRRTLLESCLGALLLFVAAGNSAVVPDYRLVALAYLPGGLLAVVWAALRLERLATGRGWRQVGWRILRTAGFGLLLSILVVLIGFVIALLYYPAAKLLDPTMPSLFSKSAQPQVAITYDIVSFVLAPFGTFEVGTPVSFILGMRLVGYLELALVFGLARLVIGLFNIPGRWLKRQGERRLLWRLTFSHFWVVFATLATSIACWTIFLTVIEPGTTDIDDLETASSRYQAAHDARTLGTALATELKANGSFTPAELEGLLRYTTLNFLDSKSLSNGLRDLPARTVNVLTSLPSGTSTIFFMDFAVITDPQGRIVGTSQPQRLATGRFLLESVPGQFQADWKELYDQAAAGQTQLSVLTRNRLEDTLLLAGSYPVKNSAGEVELIVLVSEQPETAVFGSLQILANLLTLSLIFLVSVVFTSVFSLVVALVFGYLQARRLVRGLEQLETATEGLASGNLRQRVKVEAQDEIGRLADRFNMMARQLQHSQSSLEKEKRKAEQALQTKRELVASVSHELRTPVSTIRAHVDWLLLAAEETRPGQPSADAGHLAGADERQLYQYLEIIGRETERLSALIEDLLDLSRIEERGPAVQIDRVQVAEVVQEVKQVLGLMAQRERKVTITLDLAPDLPLVMADRTRLGQVLLNLTRNAINYTPMGGIISIGAVQVGPEQIELWVADTGIGIAPEELDRIFERFYRSDASRSRNTGGAGLGLAIVKSLVEAMGGTIRVESVPGEGSKFTVNLPLAPTSVQSFK